MIPAKICVSAFAILGLFIGQAGDGSAELRQIDYVLQSARASGSLVYSSCGFRKKLPDSVQIRSLPDYSGAPRDVLHLSFGGLPPEVSHGPGVALMAIQANREVLAFRKEHNIRPIADRFMGPGDAGSPGPIVTGELNNITVSQALDHVLKTFPGFWIYENCVSEDGQRIVHFGFLERIPARPHAE